MSYTIIILLSRIDDDLTPTLIMQHPNPMEAFTDAQKQQPAQMIVRPDKYDYMQLSKTLNNAKVKDKGHWYMLSREQVRWLLEDWFLKPEPVNS